MDFDLEGLADSCPNLKVVNCAGCGELMAGLNQPDLSGMWRSGLEFMEGRIGGRPYCSYCLKPRRRPTWSHSSPFKAWRFDGEEASPWQENAIRDMEDM